MDEDVIDVETFRGQARSWLEENLERRDAARPLIRLRSVEHKTVEGIAEQRKIQRTLYDGGYAGISIPKHYGGRGLTQAHERAFNDEAEEYVTPDFGVVGRTTSACSRTMLAHASSDFLKRHIPRIIAGEELWVQFFSEPEAGSDLAAVRTRATRDGDGWILNGTKIWSSGAYNADYGMCLARTNWDVPKHHGLTWFAVSTTAPGVTIRSIKQINGDAEFCEEFLDDIELNADDIIGEVDKGWAVAQTMLVFERGGGSSALPIPSHRRGPAPDLVGLAQRVGRDKDPVVCQLIARAHINDFARHQLTRRITSRMSGSNGTDAAIAAYGKLAEGTLAPIRARIAMEIGGGNALVWQHGDIDGMRPSVNYLNGRMMSIAGGTNEMQRNAIGERVLGLPREPSFDSKKPFSEVIRDIKNWMP